MSIYVVACCRCVNESFVTMEVRNLRYIISTFIWSFFYMSGFRRKRNRLKWYDYSTLWMYFITLCTHEMQHRFWEVVWWKMIMNDVWKLVEENRYWIPQVLPTVWLDQFVVMPNHVHWIIVLPWENDVSLSRVVKWFKYGCTKIIRQTNPWFLRQKSFYDNVVRSELSYEKIARYIDTNPLRRELDKFYTLS